MGALYIKYTWSIGCCATWCIMPVPLSCHSLVTFKLLNQVKDGDGLFGVGVLIDLRDAYFI